MELGDTTFTVEDNLKIMNIYLIPKLRSIGEKLRDENRWLAYLEYDYDNDSLKEGIETVNSAKDMIEIFKQKGDRNLQRFKTLFNINYKKLKHKNAVGVVIITKFNYSEYNFSLLIYKLEMLLETVISRKMFIYARNYEIDPTFSDRALIELVKIYEGIISDTIDRLLDESYGKILLISNNLNKATLDTTLFETPHIYTSMLIVRMVHQYRILFFKDMYDQYRRLIIFEVIHYLKVYFILFFYEKLDNRRFKWTILRNPGDTSVIT